MSILAEIATFLSLVAALVAVVISVRKAPKELKQLDVSVDSGEADVAAKYQQIADRAAESALKLDARVQQLEEKVMTQQATIDDLKCENAELRLDHEKLSDEFDRVVAGAHVLHKQVVGLNEAPLYVPPDRRRRKGQPK